LTTFPVIIIQIRKKLIFAKNNTKKDKTGEGGTARSESHLIYAFSGILERGGPRMNLGNWNTFGKVGVVAAKRHVCIFLTFREIFLYTISTVVFVLGYQ